MKKIKTASFNLINDDRLPVRSNIHSIEAFQIKSRFLAPIHTSLLCLKRFNLNQTEILVLGKNIYKHYAIIILEHDDCKTFDLRILKEIRYGSDMKQADLPF